jgi:hypothetical protein
MEILDAANVNGEGFVPDGTDYIALILAPGSGVMITIIEYLYDADGDGLSFDDEIDYNTNPANPDSDGDGLSDGDEIDLGTDPTGTGSDDTDGDGIPDGSDPSIIAGYVNGLDPDDGYFGDEGGGKQSAIDSICADIEQKILSGDCDEAVKKLNNLRKHLDGCFDASGSPDKNDWIIDCATQVQVRQWVDTLIDNLEADCPS